jgi:hypothetical protein
MKLEDDNEYVITQIESNQNVMPKMFIFKVWLLIKKNYCDCKKEIKRSTHTIKKALMVGFISESNLI